MKDIGSVMQRALDGAWARHEILANNIANAETPGYKRLEVDFRNQLSDAMSRSSGVQRTDPRHLTASDSYGFSVSQDLSSYSPDGNSVDLDIEMGELSTNALYYSMVGRHLSAHLAMLRKALTEGRR